MRTTELINKISNICEVKTNPVTLNNYAYDASPLAASLPLCVVFAKNSQQLSEVVKLCNEYKYPIIARGAGSNLCGSTIASNREIIIEMKHFNQIEEIDLDNLTITVQAGVVTQVIAEAVSKHGLMYPPDPGSIKVSTIGGNIAQNSGGLRGLKYGVTSDYVLALEVIMADGQIINTGGKLTKDVAGYNLTQLIVGSEGSLGIVTKATLKLIPQPIYKKTITAYFDKLGDAGDVVSDIISNHIIPATLEIIDKVTLGVVENHAKIGLDTTKEAFLLIEQDGNESQVNEDINKIIEICKKYNGIIRVAKDSDEAQEISLARRNCLGALASLAPTTLLEDATVPRSEVGKFLRAIESIAKKYEVDIYTFGHAGDGNMHPTAPCDIRDHEHFSRVEKAYEEIYEVAISLGGTITGEHGVGKMKAPYLEMKAQNSLHFMSLIKKALDPNNILNPGIIFVKGDDDVIIKES